MQRNIYSFLIIEIYTCQIYRCQLTSLDRKSMLNIDISVCDRHFLNYTLIKYIDFDIYSKFLINLFY